MNLIYCPVCDHLLQIDHSDMIGQGSQRCMCSESWGEQLVRYHGGESRAVYGGQAVAVVIDRQQLKSLSDPMAPRATYGSVYYPKPDDEFFGRAGGDKE